MRKISLVLAIAVALSGAVTTPAVAATSIVDIAAKKAAAPKGLKIKTKNTLEGTAVWKARSGATGYQVQIEDAEPQTTRATSFKLIASGGEQVRVRAKVKAKWTEWSKWVGKPLTGAEKRETKEKIEDLLAEVRRVQGYVAVNTTEIYSLKEQKKVADDYKQTSTSASIQAQINVLENQNSDYNRDLDDWLEDLARLRANLKL